MPPNPKSQLYYPSDQSEWLSTPKGERYALRRGSKAGGAMAGAALLQCGPDEAIEKQTQNDFSTGIEELIAMRSQEGCENMVVSGSVIKNLFKRKTSTRARFGLFNHNNPKYGNGDGGVNAAKACHRSIRWGVWKSNLRVIHPKFDSTKGMTGLSEWGNSVKLVRLFPPWLLLLPLLFLLLLIDGCPTGCSSSAPPPENPFQTRSWVLVIDKSSSMEEEILWARDELELYLDWMIEEQSSWDSWLWWHEDYYANIISYDDTAHSLFGELRIVSEETKEQMLQYLVDLEAAHATELKSALQLAGPEVSNHGKPTTLFVVSDAADDSIKEMRDGIAEADKGESLSGNNIDPRTWFKGFFDPTLELNDKWLEVEGEQPALFMNCKSTKYMELEVEQYDTDGDRRLSKVESTQALADYKNSRDNPSEPKPISWDPSDEEEILFDLCDKMNGNFKEGRPDLSIPFNFTPWLLIAGLLAAGSVGWFLVRSRMKSS